MRAGPRAEGVVCESANKRATELMNAKGLAAATVVLDVQTGALVAFAATSGSEATSHLISLKVCHPERTRRICDYFFLLRRK